MNSDTLEMALEQILELNDILAARAATTVGGLARVIVTAELLEALRMLLTTIQSANDLQKHCPNHARQGGPMTREQIERILRTAPVGSNAWLAAKQYQSQSRDDSRKAEFLGS
jgi:hypothetical protein